jgi:hypothetical protein
MATIHETALMMVANPQSRFTETAAAAHADSPAGRPCQLWSNVAVTSLHKKFGGCSCDAGFVCLGRKASESPRSPLVIVLIVHSLSPFLDAALSLVLDSGNGVTMLMSPSFLGSCMFQSSWG